MLLKGKVRVCFDGPLLKCIKLPGLALYLFYPWIFLFVVVV